MEIVMILVNKMVFCLLFFLCSYRPVQAMEYVQKFQKIALARVTKAVKSAFTPPKYELEAPKTIIRTPLKEGSLSDEVESIIEQVDAVLKNFKLGYESIVSCSILITNPKDKKGVFEVFKRKNFRPRIIHIKVTDLKGMKIAAEIKIFKAPKKKPDRLTSMPKKAKL
jgi:hypothetical protein